MSASQYRRFTEEVVTFIGKRVAVETSDKRSIQGVLVGVGERMDLILSEVVGVDENVIKMVINGEFVKEIKLLEKPFDLRALSERLTRVFPGMVSLREDVQIITVMDKIRVSEQGVVGEGLATDKVKGVFDEFVRDSKKA
ncbi:MAG: Lsm family RNA-binding protein [Nitrososphaerales archaeon]